MAHLCIEQRYAISLYLKEKRGVNEIARLLDRSPSVISREISRNSSEKTRLYNYKPAQLRADNRKETRSYFRRLTTDVTAFISSKIKEDLSPEQVVGYAQINNIECVSVPTIYKYIEQDKQNPDITDKLYKHLRCHTRKYIKRGSAKTGQGQIPNRVMIDERPDIVDKKERFGDFEADTMWLADGASLVTVNDRVTSISFIKEVPSRKADVVQQALVDLLMPFKGYIKSITVDNGKEFSNHLKIAEILDTNIYFAHRYHSWERGANENTNRLYRQYFKNKTKITDFDTEYRNLIQSKLNNRPRKKMNFLSPYQFLFANFDLPAVAFTI